MSDPKVHPKPRVSSLEAQRLLIDAVIHLAESIPFPEITARRIAHEVHMDPNVIFRNFDSVENLLIAVLRFLEERTLRFLADNEPIGITPIGDLFLWVKLSTWLSLSGTKPDRLAVDPHVITSFLGLSADHLRVSPSASERAQAAAMVIAFSFIQAQAMFTPAQPRVFTPQAMADSMVLLASMMERLDELTDDWK